MHLDAIQYTTIHIEGSAGRWYYGDWSVFNHAGFGAKQLA